jgi:hypothetical protein
VKRLVRQTSKAVNEGWVARVWLGLRLGLARWVSANHASGRRRRWTLRPNGPSMTPPWTGGRWGPKIALMGYLPRYKTTQQPPPSDCSNVRSAALVAASNTSSTPSPLKLEHSRYRLALISLAATSPSCGVTNRSDFFRISSIATGSSRRSFLRPTRIMGTPAHSRVASSTH